MTTVLKLQCAKTDYKMRNLIHLKRVLTPLLYGGHLNENSLWKILLHYKAWNFKGGGVTFRTRFTNISSSTTAGFTKEAECQFCDKVVNRSIFQLTLCIYKSFIFMKRIFKQIMQMWITKSVEHNLMLSYAKESNKGSTEAPLLSVWRVGTALIKAAIQILSGHVSQLGTFLSNMDYWNAMWTWQKDKR